MNNTYNECDDCPNSTLCDQFGDFCDCDAYEVFSEEAKEAMNRVIYLLLGNEVVVMNEMSSIATSLAVEIQTSELISSRLNAPIVKLKIDMGGKLYDLKSDVQFIGAESWHCFFARIFKEFGCFFHPFERSNNIRLNSPLFQNRHACVNAYDCHMTLYLF